jgi:hypothetical protein
VGEPIDDTSETHGICERHQQAMLERFPSRSFPSTRWLLIVSPSEPAAYCHLVTVMRDVAGVTVIVDRRRGERRRGGESPAAEHRHLDRRIRRPERSRLGYTLVRFGRVTPDSATPERSPPLPTGANRLFLAPKS